MIMSRCPTSLFVPNAMNPHCPIMSAPIVAPIRVRPSSRKRRLRGKVPVNATGWDNAPRVTNGVTLDAIQGPGNKRQGKGFKEGNG